MSIRTILRDLRRRLFAHPRCESCGEALCADLVIGCMDAFVYWAHPPGNCITRTNSDPVEPPYPGDGVQAERDLVPAGASQTRSKPVLLLIGCGEFAASAYLPALARTQEVKTAAVVEIASRTAQTQALIDKLCSTDFHPEVVSTGTGSSKLTSAAAARLSRLVEMHAVTAVIISTSPDAHSTFLHWALDNNLHVLVDKPILSAANLTTEPVVAPAVWDDFASLSAKVAAKPHLVVSVATQRRWHSGFKVVRDAVVEAAVECGVPITSIQSTHQDGQLRLPHEIGTIPYHGYMAGVGKWEHSAYHEVDLQTWLIRLAAAHADVTYDSLTTYAQTTRPDGFLRNHPRRVWESLFGIEAWAEACPDDDATLSERYRGYGEIDLAAQTSLTIGGIPALQSTLNMNHNSVSARNWLAARSGWWKDSGRQKVEVHVINQGFEQSVVVYSCRGVSDTGFGWELGDNSHFDVTIVRNASLWRPGTPSIQVVTAADIAAKNDLDANHSLMAHARDAMLANFIANLSGARAVDDNLSPWASHQMAMSLFTAVAQSAASHNPVSRSLHQ
jgi:predicted dehydrogenase